MTKRGRFCGDNDRLRHIDSRELRHADGKIHMFLAIDRVSKFTFVELYDKAGNERRKFLRHAIEAFPYKIHTVITDNGIAFADLPKTPANHAAILTRRSKGTRKIGLHGPRPYNTLPEPKHLVGSACA